MNINVPTPYERNIPSIFSVSQSSQTQTAQTTTTQTSQTQHNRGVITSPWPTYVYEISKLLVPLVQTVFSVTIAVLLIKFVLNRLP